MTRRQHGTVLVEFALVAPLLLVLLFGTIEMGRVLNAMVLVSNASREGARRGSVGASEDQVKTAVRNYLTASGLDATRLSAQVTKSTVSGTRQIDVKLTYALPLLMPSLHLVPNPMPISGTTVMRVE